MKAIGRAALSVALVLMAGHAFADVPAAPIPAATSPAPASVAPPYAISESERDQLGLEIASRFLGAGSQDPDGDLTNRVVGDFKGVDLTDFKFRPEWPDLFRASMVEEFQLYMPRFKQLLAREMLKDFTIEELRAGAVFARSAGGRQILASPRAPISAQGRKAEQTLMSSPAGRGFMNKLQALRVNEAQKETVAKQMMAEFLPRTLLRFAREARAREKPPHTPTMEEDLAARLSRVLLAIGDIDASFAQGLPDFEQSFSQPTFPASWRGIASDAAKAELQKHRDMLNASLAPVLARRFSTEELSVGVAFLDSAPGQEFVAVARAKAKGDTTAALSKTARKALIKLTSQPAGKAFMDKVGQLDNLSDEEASSDFIASFVLDILEDFARKAMTEGEAGAQPA